MNSSDGWTFTSICDRCRIEQEKEEPVRIKKVIFNPPATIVFWDDGTKTVVKCTECGGPSIVGHKYIEGKYTCNGFVCENSVAWRQSGILNAIAKKMYGSKYISDMKKWVDNIEYM